MNSAEKILRSLIEKNKTPSVRYTIFNRDKVIFQFCDGFADIENRTKTTEETPFHAYSVTKTFTALAVLQLAERNKLKIDDLAKKYLKDFPYSGDITIQQLITHTAGIPNPIPLSWIHLLEEHATFNRNEFFKKIIAKHSKVRSKPNEKFSYSNLGYVILGQLIENITGMLYEDYITKNILEPLDIHQDELSFTICSHHARGYQDTRSLLYPLLGFMLDKKKFMDEAAGKWKPFKSLYVNGTSYGGLIGTNKAFEKYLQSLMSSDDLLSHASKKLFFTENRLNSNRATGMCLSWFTGVLNGRKFFTHAGGGGGYYCELRLYPEVQTGSVIMFNRTGMSDERFLNNLDRFFIR